MPDAFLDAEVIRASTFVRHIEIHETLGSTNDRAAELARDPDIELPALVAARLQTAGRGRGTNAWWSSDGALTFSVLLHPATHGISTANWPPLSLATAVAVCDALAIELKQASSPPATLADEVPRSNPPSEIRNPKSLRLAIKWPNDVMLDGAKICGILIESPGGGAPAKDRLIIGIGINVNNLLRFAPTEPIIRMTSLCEASGRQHSLQTLLFHVLDEFRRNMAYLERRDAQLTNAWQNLCWLSRQRVRVETAIRTIEGTCEGIADDGALVVRTTGSLERIYNGHVQSTL